MSMQIPRTLSSADTTDVAIGYQSLSSASGQSQTHSTSMGYRSLRVSTANDCTAFGYQSLLTNSSGTRNIGIGSIAGTSNTTGSDNVYIGYQSGNNSNSISNITIGSNSGYCITSGSANIVLGSSISNTNSNVGAFTGSANTIVGNSILSMNTSNTNLSTGSCNVIVGYNSMSNKVATSSFTGSNNTVLGTGSALNAPTMSNSVIIGQGILTASVATLAVTATSNVIIGHGACAGGVSSPVSGTNNVVVGDSSATSLTSASSNVIIGAGSASLLSTSINNVIIGYSSGNTLTTGTGNIIIGKSSDVSSGTRTGAILIGYNVSGTTDNELTIGTNITQMRAAGMSTAASDTKPVLLYDTVSGVITRSSANFSGGGGTITGTGTINTVAKFTGATSIGNSVLTDDGTQLIYDPTNISSNSELTTFQVLSFTQTISGSITNARYNQLLSPTITSISPQTVTNAATLYVDRPPQTSGLATITNAATVLLGPSTDQSIQVLRNQTANTAGHSLTLSSGGATSGATNKAGGTLALTSGVSTGNGLSYVTLRAPSVNSPSSTTDVSPADRFTVVGSRFFTGSSGSSSLNLLQITIPANTPLGASGRIQYSVNCCNATTGQTCIGQVVWLSAVANASAPQYSIVQIDENSLTAASGTLSTSWSISGSGTATISVTSTTSLTSVTVWTINYVLFNNSPQAITVL